MIDRLEAFALGSEGALKALSGELFASACIASYPSATFARMLSVWLPAVSARWYRRFHRTFMVSRVCQVVPFTMLPPLIVTEPPAPSWRAFGTGPVVVNRM